MGFQNGIQSSPITRTYIRFFLEQGKERECWDFKQEWHENNSKRDRVRSFLYDPQNSDHQYAFMNLQEVVVFYLSNSERLAFEDYIEINQTMVSNKINEASEFDYIDTGDEKKTTIYKERLRTGVALNELLEEWRRAHNIVL